MIGWMIALGVVMVGLGSCAILALYIDYEDISTGALIVIIGLSFIGAGAIIEPTNEDPYMDTFIEDIVTYEDENIHHASTLYYKNMDKALEYIKEHNGEITSISDYKLRENRGGQDGVLIV